jgi:hypothetical protein
METVVFLRRRCVYWRAGLFDSVLVVGFTFMFLYTSISQTSATADQYMGDRRKRGPLTCSNIPLSHKEHAIALLSVNGRKVIDKVAINHLFCIHKFKVFFFSKQLFIRIFNSNYFVCYMSCIDYIILRALRWTATGHWWSADHILRNNVLYDVVMWEKTSPRVRLKATYVSNER